MAAMCVLIGILEHRVLRPCAKTAVSLSSALEVFVESYLERFTLSPILFYLQFLKELEHTLKQKKMIRLNLET